jgi:hypothetical protein
MILWTAMLPLAGAAAGAQETAPATAYDPLDPASCATMDGHTAVYKAWLIARDGAAKSGKLDAETAQKLAVWLLSIDNWMIQTNEVRRHCELLIEVRKEHGF